MVKRVWREYLFFSLVLSDTSITCKAVRFPTATPKEEDAGVMKENASRSDWYCYLYWDELHWSSVDVTEMEKAHYCHPWNYHSVCSSFALEIVFHDYILDPSTAHLSNSKGSHISAVCRVLGHYLQNWLDTFTHSGHRLRWSHSSGLGQRNCWSLRRI